VKPTVVAGASRPARSVAQLRLDVLRSLTMAIEVGMRELRNSTSKVLEAVEAGQDVFLTNHGVRVARITPITFVGTDWTQRFDQLMADLPFAETGFARFHDDDNRSSIEAEEAARG